MRGVNIVLVVALVASITLVGLTGSAGAAKVGISGSCDDDDQNSTLEGEGGTQVDTDEPPATVEDLGDNPGGDQLANTGFVWFALGSGHNDACDRDDTHEDNGDDYLEAHVTTEQGQVRFCQSEGHHEDGHIHLQPADENPQRIDFNENDSDNGHHGQCKYDSEGNHHGAGSEENRNAEPL